MDQASYAQGELKVAVTGSQDYLKSTDLALPYIISQVCPPLEQALQHSCTSIEDSHHTIDQPIRNDRNFVIHYTSIAALVSMLQDVSREEPKDQEAKCPEEPEGKKALWRLYDSLHLNDPEEGVLLSRHLRLPRKHAWLKESEVSHAYIASFILPDDNPKKDVDDNLVFWRTYGREGEGCSLSLPIPRCHLRRVLYGRQQLKCTIDLLRPTLP